MPRQIPGLHGESLKEINKRIFIKGMPTINKCWSASCLTSSDAVVERGITPLGVFPFLRETGVKQPANKQLSRKGNESLHIKQSKRSRIRAIAGQLYDGGHAAVNSHATKDLGTGFWV
jgi:hypothetical protein